MTTGTGIDVHRAKALEIAAQHGGEKPPEVVARANAYHAFLTSTAAAKPAATAGAPGPKAPAAEANKGANATPPAGKATTKPGAAAGAAAKPGAAAAAAKPAAGKPAAAATGKPAAGKPAAAAKAAAGQPTGAAVPADTKAPGGKNTYADVVAALRNVQQAKSKDDALAVLAKAGGGTKSVRDLKPANYDAVVAACATALDAPTETETETDPLDDGLGGGGDDGEGDPPEHTAGGLDAEMDPTAQPDRDEMGLS